jgi:hypothetical protein
VGCDAEELDIFMVRKPNNCCRCGCYISGVKYNPYNVTFEKYAFHADEKMMCLKCAERYVKGFNKCLGGHWELREWEEAPSGIIAIRSETDG